MSTLNKKALVLSVFAAVFFAFSPLAHAATPVLTLSSTGSGDNVLVNVTGDPNSNIALYYNVGSSGGMLTYMLGATDGNGSFSTTLSSSARSANAGQQAYVLVNSQQSAMVLWPYYSSYGSLTLSPSSLSLAIGQSGTISSTGSSNSIFITNNTNPSIASISISGTQITATAVNAGYSTVTFCYQNNSSVCANAYITVTNTNNQSVTFGQSSVQMNFSQYASVSISGGSGNYTVTNNSNPSIVQASVTGTNSLSLTSLTSSGTSLITVCTSGTGYCGVLSVTVGSANSSIPTFSQNSVCMNLGAVQTVSVYGSGSYVISSNSMPNIASATLNGNILTLTGLLSGSTNINVCQTNGGCAALIVSVGGGSGSVTFSQTNPVLSVGQSLNIYLSGGTGQYYLGTGSNTVVQAGISGTTLTLYGLSAGSYNVNVCATSGGCSLLYVTVSGGTTTPSGTLTLAQVLSVGQAINLLITGGAAPYYVSGNSGSVFSTQILNTSVLQVKGISAGTGSASVCGASGGCVTLNVTVVGVSGTPAPPSGSRYIFTWPLSVGASGEEVSELQKRLLAEGFYSGDITGYFGYLTQAAVKRYQAAHGLTPLGNVGPATRAALNSQ